MAGQYSTHATLLARLGDGRDSTGWRDFCERYEQLIRGFAARRGLQPSDCDDVLQDVLLSLTSALPQFRYDPARGKFRSYLKTITLRAIFRRQQARHGEVNAARLEEQTRVAATDDEHEAAWDAEWRQHHLRQAMKQVRAEFSADQQRVFHLYAEEDRDPREVATLTGHSVDAVYKIKSRMLQRISALIQQQVADEG